MPSPFVNRESELAALDSWWRRPTAGLGLVWGRRRVGKTAVLQRFAEGRRAVFHTAVGRPAVDELRELSRVAAGVLGAELRDPLSDPYTRWDDVLEALGRAAQEQPLLVVLDEFPELVRTSPELPGIIRAFWDRARDSTGLRILLCGSAVRVMTAIQEERAPLYGRFDLRLPVHPFLPHEAAAMLPLLSPADRARAYGIVGGLPLHLGWWDQQAGVAANVEALFGHAGAPLLTDGQLLLAGEVDIGGLPEPVLRAVAGGRSRHNEIRDAVRAEPARTLDRLVELRLLERVVPVTEDPRATRRRSYRIADNLLAFWLGVVDRYRSEIERGLGLTIVPSLLAGLDDHMGPVWEEAFRAHLRRLAAGGELGPDVVAVGRWWRDDGGDELDAVVLSGRSRAATLVGEAKWTSSVDARSLEAVLRQRTHRLPAVASRVRLALCARDRVREPAQGTLVVTAADIFGGPNAR